jgi:Concanavalin A-like lectin/glucanases superfamily
LNLRNTFGPASARSRGLGWAALSTAILLAGCSPAPQSSPSVGPAQKLWRFDRLDNIGGLPVRAEGGPQLVRTGAGRAIAFDGVNDALFLPDHPLAGATTFSFEAIFRPDGGAFEQRWFHLAQADPASPPRVYPPVQASGPRFLFEIRVVPGGWYLDAFTAGNGYKETLIVPEKLHPLGRWYRVAQTYDGHVYRSYVDGELQAEAPLAFAPQGPGYASVGTRINRRNYFHGAVYAARFTDRALSPREFMKLPAGLR